ncbi:L,D-transpeptidase family protein [Ectothiorhodospira mobilis]|uniref:L,D-transpeptidase family protein n=1 Tax=Ectothiorhodospira mobilis TaxID=195064 RepID=UPI0030B821AB
MPHKLPRSVPLLTGLLAALWCTCAAAQTRVVFPLQEDTAVVGGLRHVEARHEDTLIDVARRHRVGFQAIRLANPELNTWIPGEGARVLLPLLFVLPDTPKRGIVINLPEMRLYHFHAAPSGEGRRVATYPVSIGRREWGTPQGTLEVIQKREDPTWTPPDSVRQAYAAQGKSLPDVVPAGPDNPLGAYALRLSRPTYLIHGTNWSTGIGLRSTHGCIRMDNDDIGVLFPHVDVGTPVHIVHQAVKAGWRDGVLYLEVHPPLEERATESSPLETAMERVMAAVAGREARVDWNRVRATVTQASGVPRAVGWTAGHAAAPLLATPAAPKSPDAAGEGAGQPPSGDSLSPVSLIPVPAGEQAQDWFVRMGRFRDEERALVLSAHLEADGFASRVVGGARGTGAWTYHVLLGPAVGREEAVSLAQRARQRTALEGEVMRWPPPQGR